MNDISSVPTVSDMRSIYRVLALTIFLSAAGAAFAQSSGNDEVVRVDTQLVDVPVAVTLPNGAFASSLKAANFVVYEDGKKQSVEAFSAVAAPFEVALLLDTSGSTRNDLQLIQRAAREFIAGLRPGDRVAVAAYTKQSDGRPGISVSEVLTQLTTDRAALYAALNRMNVSNGTPFYDSIEQAAAVIFKTKPAEEFRGRRALVALTDGVDSASASDFAAAKEAISEAGAVTYFIKVDTKEFFESQLLGDCESSIRFSAAQIRRYYHSIDPNGKTEKVSDFCELGDFERLAVSKRLYETADSELDELAKMSGGKVFPVADISDARSSFRSIAAELGTKYTLSYTPTNDARDGTYRKIRVETVGLPKGTTVRAREGYTAPAN